MEILAVDTAVIAKTEVGNINFKVATH
ncbi:MAG: hypothetical protein K0R94_1492, partial [Burkholderiales bacterium]|nr:hypothetical protein [Burkholderiales bacterium]